jgi:RNA polymerase sigma factor (sigma-70 family)
MEPLRRYALSRTGDPHDADDIVQETLARVLAARQDLEPGSLLAYAIVIARNVLTSDDRAAARTRRLASRVVDLREPERPDETVVDREEQAALAEALAALPADLRETMVAHAVHDVPVTSLASRAGTSPAALAAQLARTRARLRVDYLLALRREELPTEDCRPALLALSLGDRRRQRALRVGSHLLTCQVCADLSEPLLERRRALAGFLPWLVPAGLLEWLRGVFTRPGVQAGSVFAGAAVGVAAVALLVTEPWRGAGAPFITVPAAVAPTPGAVPTGGAVPSAVPSAVTEPSQSVAPHLDVCPAASPDAALAVGSQARCERGLVLEVPADEGFWVQSGPTSRLWVQLTSAGESPAWVQAGQRVSFLGSVVGHGPDYPARVGLDPLEGAADLRRQGAHVELAAADLAIVVPAP